MRTALPVAFLLAVSVVGADDKADALKAINSKDVKTRIAAAEKMAGMAGDDIDQALCEAAADPQPKVATAALASLDKVRPDLHPLVTTMIVDKVSENRTKAAIAVYKLGDKGKPAVTLANSTLSAALARRENKNALAMVNAAAASGTAGDGFPVVLSGITLDNKRDGPFRRACLAHLVKWAKGDEKREKEVVGLHAKLLNEKDMVVTALKSSGEMGAAAKEIMAPLAEKLKLSADKNIREAAIKALEDYGK